MNDQSIANRANDSKWLLDDTRLLLDALNAARLSAGFIHDSERPQTIQRIASQITEIRQERFGKGLWDYADKLKALESDFEALLEKEKSRPRWTPPPGRLYFAV